MAKAATVVRLPTPARRDAPRVAETNLHLSEILSALSYALDLTEGQPEGHCVRCCWIGTAIGKQLGLPEIELRELYYTLLLKDVGCSSNAARICQLYLTDDLTFKHDVKIVSDSVPQLLRFVAGHTAPAAGIVDRLRALLAVVQKSGDIAREVITTRCERGADIARQLHFSEAVAAGIRDLDEHYDGKGQPSRLKGKAISLYARIALMAQVVDVFDTSAGPEAALAEVRGRAGTWFDPALVVTFEKVAARPEFWAMLRSPDIAAAVLDLEPGSHAEVLDEDYLDDIATAFAQVVDSKSPFTSGHSSRVAEFTDLIAAEMGFTDAHRRWLRRAALLHDIGKLGVSNMILDKAGKLTEEEWEAIRAHPRLTEEILGRISAFAELARVAGAHHERLDGAGYPYGLKAHQISLDTRVITAADIFDALTAKRPYREALGVDAALGIMATAVGTQIDPECYAALKAAVARRRLGSRE